MRRWKQSDESELFRLRRAEVAADFDDQNIADFAVARDGASLICAQMASPGMIAALAEQDASMGRKMRQQIAPFHTAIGVSSNPVPAASSASARFSSIASIKV